MNNRSADTSGKASGALRRQLEAALGDIGGLLSGTDPLRRQLRELDPWESSFATRLLAGVAQFFDTLESGSVYFSLILAPNGWYPGGNLPLGILAEAACLLESGNEEDGTKLLMEFYAAQASSLGVDLASTYPSRGEAIRQTFQAHSVGSYCLSVPSFLVLAEAIARDHDLPSPYKKRGDTKEIRTALLRNEEMRFVVAYMAPLLVSAPIDWSKEDRERYGNPVLNRHLILHGLSRDYGTEVNSLRALSHLAYISDVMRCFARPGAIGSAPSTSEPSPRSPLESQTGEQPRT